MIKKILQYIASNAKFLGIAVTISALLYLLLPVSYYLFHEEIYKMMQDRKQKIVKVDTIKIKKKERETKEIEKKKRTRLKKFKKRFSDRFKLDLSVLAAEGDGAGMMDSGFGNVIEEGEADIPPIKKRFIPPRYPSRARTEGVEGNVVAKLLIDENGDVLTVRILKEPRHWGFGYAVIEAAQQWKFEPAKLNNMPVKVWATQVIEFKL
ncbi:MAG: energy transducer TonB [bacterium]|nr:energy transducer TonB [bacterium]